MPDELLNYIAKARPGTKELIGESVVLQPFDASKHADGLFEAVGGESNAALWQHLPIGPFLNVEQLLDVLSSRMTTQGWQPVIICDRDSDQPLGLVAYMCIREDAGSAELGCVVFGHKLQRTKAATEAFYLLAQHIFEYCHYRRYEWNCNANNEASKRAALRFGFRHEACFRNDMVVKGKSRDTEWYATTDGDWPEVKRAFEKWLAPENFDDAGVQRQSLSAFQATVRTNEQERQAGSSIELQQWTTRTRPGLVKLSGRYAVLEPLDWDEHGAGLYAATCGAQDDDIWTYLPVIKPASPDNLSALLDKAQETQGWQVMVIRSATNNEILGMASYMRHRAEHGSVEVGCVTFGKKLQRTRIATEAMYLMAEHAVGELGYRRYEWKCNNKNEASKRAAERYGFTYEGVFRNDRITKGESRDTAWYSILDTEWFTLEAAFKAWLTPGNFEQNGKQKLSLQGIRDIQK